MNHLVYLGLGSNVGDRAANLQAALDCLPPAIEILRRSPIYETEPWGYSDQADFLNCVVEAQTELGPLDLLHRLKACERDVGRQESFRYGPREIDIDILLFEDQMIKDQGLTVPHPLLTERAFILRPLADLAPDLPIPPHNQTVTEHLNPLDQSGIRLYNGGDADQN